MSHGSKSVRAGGWIVAAALATSGAAAQTAVFPTPFVVEHRVVQRDADGGTFETPPVTDYYGGSWIVSIRPDKSWLVVDFARREMTEVQPGKGTYSVLGFDRFAELSRRLASAEAPGDTAPKAATAATTASSKPKPPRIDVTEMPAPRRGQSAGAAAGTGLLPADRAGVRAFRAVMTPDDSEASPKTVRQSLSVEVWVDPTVRLGAAARADLASFEKDVIGAQSRDGHVGSADLVAAIRDRADGAFPIRVQHPLSARSPSAGTSEDVVTRLDAVSTFPVDYLKVPDGFRRVAHPLEVMVAHAESEAELNRKMGRMPEKHQ